MHHCPVWSVARSNLSCLSVRAPFSPCRSHSWTTSPARHQPAPGLPHHHARRALPPASTQMLQTPGQLSESTSRGSSKDSSRIKSKRANRKQRSGSSQLRSSSSRRQIIGPSRLPSSRASNTSNRAGRGLLARRKAQAAPKKARAAASRHHWRSCYTARLPQLQAARPKRLLLQLRPRKSEKSCCSSGRAPLYPRQAPLAYALTAAAAQLAYVCFAAAASPAWLLH